MKHINSLLNKHNKIIILNNYLKFSLNFFNACQELFEIITVYLNLSKNNLNQMCSSKMPSFLNIFSHLKFKQSIRYYSNFNRSDRKNLVLNLNRSNEFLREKIFNLAFKNAQQAALIDINNEKAYFIMGKCAYNMRQFNKAKINFEKCLELNNEHRQCQIELKNTLKRLNESSTGHFEFDKIASDLFKRVSKKECLNFDVADFKSNKISIIVNTENKSKSVIATEKIKKGTLLVVERACSAIFKYKTLKDTTILVNTDQQMFNNLIFKMKADPELSNYVYSLSPGINFERDKFNKFFVDQSRLIAICNTNQFKIHSSQFKSIDKYFTNYGENQVSGLWVLPALFNHSCVANTSIEFLGDLLIMFAKKDVLPDEELTVKYFGFEQYFSYFDRIKLTEKHNFKCKCQLCTLDKFDENLEIRESLIKSLDNKNKNIESDSISLNEILQDLKSIQNTYLNRSQLQIGLYIAFFNLACKYRLNGDWEKSADNFVAVYNISKEFFMKPFLIGVLKQAFNDYEKSNKKDRSFWCYETASEYYSKNNKTYFDKIWSEII